MFRIEMLPAQQGDALWIEYGDPTSPHRVLIDAGTPPTYQVVRDRIRQLPEGARDIELFIVTHIDTDHIGGAIDITDRREHEARIHLLMRELTHRSRNLLSVVQAIARLSAADTGSSEDFLEHFLRVGFGELERLGIGLLREFVGALLRKAFDDEVKMLAHRRIRYSCSRTSCAVFAVGMTSYFHGEPSSAARSVKLSSIYMGCWCSATSGR